MVIVKLTAIKQMYGDIGVVLSHDKFGSMAVMLNNHEDSQPFVCTHLAREDIKDLITYFEKVLGDD